MGMFDWVEYEETKCYNCGGSITEYQSKGADCNLDTIGPCDVDYFYGYCNECNTMNNYEVERVCMVKGIHRLKGECDD